MTAYKDIDAINRFIEATPEDWGIFIHMDKKSSIQSKDINCRAHVYKRKKVYWGAWEHVYVILFLLQKAFEMGDYNQYHIVSGQDFYAMSPQCIEAIVEQKAGTNYVPLTSVPDINWMGWDGGWKILRYRTLASFGDIRYGKWRQRNNMLIRYQNRYPILQRKISNWALYHSSVYCSFHRDFVEWTLSSKKAKRFINSFKNTTCSEEIIFATLIMNSPYSESVEAKPTMYMDWRRKDLILTEDDADVIKQSGCFFCRKVSDSALAAKLKDTI